MREKTFFPGFVLGQEKAKGSGGEDKLMALAVLLTPFD